jgi:hypothetical protein
MTPNCLGCKWLDAAPRPGHDRYDIRCRRFPPVVIGEQSQGQWPRVYPSAWCGEFSRASASVVRVRLKRYED